MATDCGCAESFEDQASLVRENFATACASLSLVEYGAIGPKAQRVGLTVVYTDDDSCCEFKETTKQVVDGFLEGLRDGSKVMASPIIVEKNNAEHAFTFTQYIQVV